MIWNRMLESYYNGDTDVFSSPSRKFLAGRPLKYNHEEIITVIADTRYRYTGTLVLRYPVVPQWFL